ncbi:MAG: GAF domain-containing protein, partial [Coleofasciculus sp. C2-GNP5-27]
MISNLSEQSHYPESASNGLQIARGLKAKSQNYKRLLVEVLKWTGGQPFLTQQLCRLIAQAPDSPSKGTEAQWVENLVRSHWIENWEEQPELMHLQTIR